MAKATWILAGLLVAWMVLIVGFGQPGIVEMSIAWVLLIALAGVVIARVIRSRRTTRVVAGE